MGLAVIVVALWLAGGGGAVAAGLLEGEQDARAAERVGVAQSIGQRQRDEVRILDQRSDAAGGRADVELLLVGRGNPPPVYQLAEDITARFGRPVDLRVQYQTDRLFVVSTR